MAIQCGPINVLNLSSKKVLNLANIVSNGLGYDVYPEWVCHAPHVDIQVVVDNRHIAILSYVHGRAVERAELLKKFPREALDFLLNAGILFDDVDVADSDKRLRAKVLDESNWEPLAAAYASISRWKDVDVQQSRGTSLSPSLQDLVALFGDAPTHDFSRSDSLDVISLPAVDQLLTLKALEGRRSCREFHETLSTSLPELTALLAGPFQALSQNEVTAGLVVQNKRVPSGGSLHPIEAYVLVQNVDGLTAGLYHYKASNNQLELLKEVSRHRARELAVSFCAGQPWASDAAALIAMVGRVQRQFWKYRSHNKALRVLHMDAGHLSQMAYSIATELDIGIIVSAAINERNLEAHFGLKPMEELPLAILALGHRSNSCVKQRA